MERIPCTELLISVVMPAFNAEETIGEAIQSVLEQTHKELELIIVDDASTDKTLSIAVEYARKDTRIRVLENIGNIGVSCSRNNGVDAANAEWIAFLDSDDIWVPDKLEKQCQKILEYPSCSICFTGSAFMKGHSHQCSYILSVPYKLTYQDLLKQNLISCSSALVAKAALKKYPMMNDPMIHEDFATWLKILKVEPYAIGIDEPLLIYRLSKNSKSGNKLRAARMQWRTYRIVGMTRLEAVPYFIAYTRRNIKKYIEIRKSSTRMC